MADIHKQFINFHEEIKLKRFGENKKLRDKRDKILKALTDGLARLFKDKEEPTPTYRWFHQGSYEMGTGVRPLTEGDYDIDVGISFHISVDDHEDPVEVKEWVYKSLENHTSKVRVRYPCIIVYYFKNGKPIYHVDLAIYTDKKENNGKMHLAKGYLGSQEEYRIWEEADPEGLTKYVRDCWSEDDGKQFRRTVRYLKRWRDNRFSSSGNAAPIGIGLTIAACRWFEPDYEVVDNFSGKREYNDLNALIYLVDRMYNSFVYRTHNDEYALRLYVESPVVPYNDLFDKMTNKQMKTFREKLLTLLNDLQSARDETDPVEACTLLRDNQLGSDFPVPSKKETAKTFPSAIVSSSSSA